MYFILFTCLFFSSILYFSLEFDLPYSSWAHSPVAKTHFYFGGARSKAVATLRNVPKLLFLDEIGHAKFVGIRLYSAILRNERRISSRYLEISSISLLLEEERIFVLACPGLNRLTCVTRKIRSDPT